MQLPRTSTARARRTVRLLQFAKDDGVRLVDRCVWPERVAQRRTRSTRASATSNSGSPPGSHRNVGVLANGICVPSPGTCFVSSVAMASPRASNVSRSLERDLAP